MNKYYTPKIEEFYYDFEYEVNHKIRDGSGNRFWCKESFRSSQENLRFVRQLLFNDRKNIRVKYLDKEDIESFGFFTEDNGECYNKLEGFTIFGLYPWEKPNEYKITIENNTVFLGIIKNKSELKKLLKQLDINV